MKLIDELENPFTAEYVILKERICSSLMNWFFQPCTADDSEDDVPYYSHTVLMRPDLSIGAFYSRPTSEYIDDACNVIDQIFKYNNIDYSLIYRINFNSTFSNGKNKKSPWHKDLQFPHNNLIIYINKFSNGWTHVRNGDAEVKSSPEEDGIIVFSGDLEHCHTVPKDCERRIVLMANYL